MSLQTRLAALVSAIGADIKSLNNQVASYAATATTTTIDGGATPSEPYSGVVATTGGGISSTLVDAKGDLIAATAADTVARFPVGSTTGHVLTVDPASSVGISWQAPSAGSVSSSSISDSTVVGRSLITAEDAASARTTIGAGTSSFSGAYGDLTGAPALSSEPFIVSVTGAITVAAGKSKIVMQAAYAVESIHAYANTAPTGAAIIVDVNKNGTTLFTTQGNRPTISASGNSSTNTAPNVTTFAIGDILSVDVDQVGSIVAGSDLTVTIRLRRI